MHDWSCTCFKCFLRSTYGVAFWIAIPSVMVTVGNLAWVIYEHHKVAQRTPVCAYVYSEDRIEYRACDK